MGPAAWCCTDHSDSPVPPVPLLGKGTHRVSSQPCIRRGRALIPWAWRSVGEGDECFHHIPHVLPQAALCGCPRDLHLSHLQGKSRSPCSSCRTAQWGPPDPNTAGRCTLAGAWGAVLVTGRLLCPKVWDAPLVSSPVSCPTHDQLQVLLLDGHFCQFLLPRARDRQTSGDQRAPPPPAAEVGAIPRSSAGCAVLPEAAGASGPEAVVRCPGRAPRGGPVQEGYGPGQPAERRASTGGWLPLLLRFLLPGPPVSDHRHGLPGRAQSPRCGAPGG